jgi:uncharacterized protein YecE (DUF72 family)
LSVVEVFAGTSGFSYKAWRGRFYPEDLPASRMLTFYAERLATVEINNTFYRMPRTELLRGWAEQVPASFHFALKASRRITHVKRLRDAGEELAILYRVARVLGEHRGPILFQLPPFLRADVERLRGFLSLLPEGHQAVFEFRHPSWHDAPVFDALREAGAALCLADSGGESDAPFVATADFGYLRLRRAGYGDADLAGWQRRVRGAPWRRAFVFFKHEDEAAGPALAARFQALFARPRRAARRAAS